MPREDFGQDELIELHTERKNQKLIKFVRKINQLVKLQQKTQKISIIATSQPEEKKRIVVTFFPSFQTFHENKDVLYVGNLIAQLKDWTHYVASERAPQSAKHYKLTPKKFKTLGIVSVITFLNRGDIIVLLHNTPGTILNLTLMWLANVFFSKKLKAIVKLDVNSRDLQRMTKFSKYKLNFLISLTNVCLYENSILKDNVSEINRKKIIHVYNFPADYKTLNLDQRIIREKSIIWIGRHGTEQKNSINILNKLIEYKAELLNREILVVGDINNEFLEKLKVAKRKGLKLAILGNIRDRREYWRVLSSGAISLNFSNWEGGNPLASAESVLAGCTIVGYKHLQFLDDLKNAGILSYSYTDIDEFLNDLNTLERENEKSRNLSALRFRTIIERQNQKLMERLCDEVCIGKLKD